MSDEDLAYFRAVEDNFARLRGTSFLFTPKDFALLRRWRDEAVPLAAVLAGIGEVMARRREQGDDPVSSLAYCRHAVARHAKRLAAAAVGGAGGAPGADVPAALAAWVAAIRAAASRWASVPAVGDALSSFAAAAATLPADAPPAALADTAASLEGAWLEAVEPALPERSRVAVAAEVAAAQDAAGGGEALPATARRAVRLRALRDLLALPHLELEGDAPEG